MTAPESDPAHGPEAGLPPEMLAGGQRTLAAIVFTDTVGFSALMNRDEVGTLRLVARDLDQMRVLCASFGGHVLKSTGDGLLILFTSAVQAVACALEIQREFQKQHLDLPKNECLMHRIGIHLGDIFQHEGDVMGDGVNIAARLQTEAVPGGICLSNTVYDVVHNRLPFYVNDLGARNLKNIGLVKAYQISPFDTGQSRFRLMWYRWRSWVWMLLAVPLVLAALFGVYQWGKKHEGARIKAHDAEKLAKTQAARAAAMVTNPPPIDPTLPGVSSEVFNVKRHEFMEKYDFDAMIDWIDKHNWPGKPSEKLSEKCREMNYLFDWIRDGLRGRTAGRPLVAHEMNGKKTEFWPTAFGGLKVRNEGQILTLQRAEIPPSMIGEIARELMIETALTPDEGFRVNKALMLFVDYYHVRPTGPSTPAQTEPAGN